MLFPNTRHRLHNYVRAGCLETEWYIAIYDHVRLIYRVSLLILSMLFLDNTN